MSRGPGCGRRRRRLRARRPRTAWRPPASTSRSSRPRTDRGKLGTVHVGDLQVEAGADSFVARKPWAVELCREIGLGDELVSPGASGAFLWTDRGLVAFPKDAPFGIPGDLGDVFRWPGLSRAGRRRAAQDLLRGKRKDGIEETLGGLLRRRLGDEATDLAVAPLLAGLYAGDVDRLSARATFPELLEWESSQGSLIRGSQATMRAARRGIPKPMFVKPRGGVQRLTDTLAASLGDRVLTGRPIGSLAELGHDVGATVLAVPAFEAGRLVRSAAPVDGRRAPYDLLRVDRRGVPDLRRRHAGGVAERNGFVVPRGKAPMTACTWLSSKWPDPAFGSRAVVRCYVGGIGDEALLDAGTTSWSMRVPDICRRSSICRTEHRLRRSFAGFARCPNTRSGMWNAFARSARRSLRVSSWSGRPTMGRGSPIASARQARRPTRFSPISGARRSTRRRLDE